jgi:hypothetical protein
MSRLETMASISSRLSLGTITSSACAGVTTPPTVWIASCCTTPSTGAANRCSVVLRSALIRSCVSPFAFCSAFCEFVRQGLLYSAYRLAARLAYRRHRGLRFRQMALLDAEAPPAASTSSCNISK